MRYATDLEQSLNNDLRNSLIDVYDFQFEGYGSYELVAPNVWSFGDLDETVAYDERAKRFYGVEKINGNYERR